VVEALVRTKIETATRSGCRHLRSVLIGATGFEPAAFWSQTRRSSQAELRPECGNQSRHRRDGRQCEARESRESIRSACYYYRQLQSLAESHMLDVLYEDNHCLAVV